MCWRKAREPEIAVKIPQTFVALLSGALFGSGLILSGMTNPANVLSFLDVAGAWNPALAIVMATAIAVASPVFYVIRRRGRNLAGETVSLDNRRPVDARLVIGSVLFGIGWGISGICPGPGLMIAAGGVPFAILFVGAMTVGMWFSRFWPDQSGREQEG